MGTNGGGALIGLGAPKAATGRLPRILAIEHDALVLRNWTLTLAGIASVVPVPSIADAARCTELEHWRSDPFPFVFLDLNLPDGDAFHLLQRLADVAPRPQIAVLTDTLDAELAVRLHGSCAIAAPRPEDRKALLGVLGVLRSAARGESTLEHFAHLYRLSPQEMRLLSLAVQEVPNKQAADELGCSECTVRTYWSRIFAKVGCTTQRDIVARLFKFAETRSVAAPPDFRTGA